MNNYYFWDTTPMEPEPPVPIEWEGLQNYLIDMDNDYDITDDYCPECDGVGQVMKLERDSRFGDELYGETCPACHGSGMKPIVVPF